MLVQDLIPLVIMALFFSSTCFCSHNKERIRFSGFLCPLLHGHFFHTRGLSLGHLALSPPLLGPSPRPSPLTAACPPSAPPGAPAWLAHLWQCDQQAGFSSLAGPPCSQPALGSPPPTCAHSSCSSALPSKPSSLRKRLPALQQLFHGRLLPLGHVHSQVHPGTLPGTWDVLGQRQPSQLNKPSSFKDWTANSVSTTNCLSSPGQRATLLLTHVSEGSFRPTVGTCPSRCGTQQLVYIFSFLCSDV